MIFDDILKETEPIYSGNRFRISIHSPVTIDVYDTSDNHTGKVCPSNSDFCYVEENIINSSSLEFGEGKYLNLPEEGIKNIKINGSGTGTFLLNIEEFQGDTFIANTTFKDIPVTPNTKVSLDIENNINSLSQMHIDTDGNGTIDFNLNPKLNGIVTMPKYIFSGFTQPINDTAHQVGQNLSVFKAGSTIPVKFQLKNLDGIMIKASSDPVWSIPQQGSKMIAAIDESVYSIVGTTGNTFKYDTVGQQYIYNWSTKGLLPGYWYKIFAKLDDGYMYSVTIGLK